MTVIVTNHHVVWGAGEVTIERNDGTTARAEVLGTDPEMDLAVLRLAAEAKGNPRPLSFGDDEPLHVGDRLMAIGSPGGVRNAVTPGNLAARGKVPNATLAAHEFVDYLFVHTVMAAGSSGGPVLAMDGRVVGVSTGAVGGAPGLGIVLPGRMVAWVVETIRRGGSVRHSASGLQVADVTGDGPEGAVKVTLPVGENAGAPSGADEAVRPGDVIVKVDGKRLTGARDFRWREFVGGPGASWRLDVMRDGNKTSSTLTLQPLTQEIFARRGSGQSPPSRQ